MVTHYIDVTVMEGPELSSAHIMGALYERVHLALVRHGTTGIGVSFPGYQLSPRTLGDALRIHGSSDSLQRVFEGDWLKGVRDHVQVSGITPVPPGVMHRVVQRRQFKTSADRLRRRRMRRKGETTEQAVAAIPDAVERRPDLPYVRLRSGSTSQTFCLFIAVGDLVPVPVGGVFNSHGLSACTTVPWF